MCECLDRGSQLQEEESNYNHKEDLRTNLKLQLTKYFSSEQVINFIFHTIGNDILSTIEMMTRLASYADIRDEFLGDEVTYQEKMVGSGDERTPR